MKERVKKWNEIRVLEREREKESREGDASRDPTGQLHIQQETGWLLMEKRREGERRKKREMGRVFWGKRGKGG